MTTVEMKLPDTYVDGNHPQSQQPNPVGSVLPRNLLQINTLPTSTTSLQGRAHPMLSPTSTVLRNIQAALNAQYPHLCNTTQ